MTVLAIETATPIPSVALCRDARIRAHAFAARSSFRETVATIEALLSSVPMPLDRLEAITICAGPGSFTGLRIGATAAITIADLRGIPLIAVPTPALIAEALAPATASRVCVSFDARRGRRYAALCERGGPGWTLTDGPVDIAPGDVERWSRGTEAVRLENWEHQRGTLAGVLAAWVDRELPSFETSEPRSFELHYTRPAVVAD